MENYVPMEKLWERHPVRDFYHIYSDGTRVSVLFETPKDKAFARNLIAVLAFKYHVKVYCDVVMDTHLHLIAHGKPEDIAHFEAQLKRQVAMFLNRTGRSNLLKEKFEVAHELIGDDVELMRKIIYVFRNPLDAGYPYLPEDYPWGVGRLFFHPFPTDKGRKVKDMTWRERVEVFRTQEILPDEWEVDADGMLMPRCYIDVDGVHRLFVSPKRFIAFLHVKKKDLVDQDTKCAQPFLEKRGDSELHAEAEAESRRLFGRRVTKLTQAERIQVAGILWKERRTLSRKQLARAVRMNPDLIGAVFH